MCPNPAHNAPGCSPMTRWPSTTAAPPPMNPSTTLHRTKEPRWLQHYRLDVVVAVAAMLLTVGACVGGAHQTQPIPPRRTDKVRGAAKEKILHVSRQDALADETAVKARAARAEGDVKASQASGLQQQAAANRNEAATSRGQLNDQWDRANALEIRAHRHPTRRSRPTIVNLNTTDGLILDGWTRTSDGDGVATSMSWPSAVNVASSSRRKRTALMGRRPRVTPACVLRCNTSASATT